MTITIEQFKSRYSSGYVYHTESGKNFGNAVYINQWGKALPTGQADYSAQVGLGIDCSGLQERWQLENGYNIPYMPTRSVMTSQNPGVLASGADKYYTVVQTADIKPGDIVYFNGHAGIVSTWNSSKGTGTVFQSGNTGVKDLTFDPTTGMLGGLPFLGVVRPKPEWQQNGNAVIAEERLQLRIAGEVAALKKYNVDGIALDGITDWRTGGGSLPPDKDLNYQARTDQRSVFVMPSQAVDLSGLSRQQRIDRFTMTDAQFDLYKTRLASVEVSGKWDNPNASNYGYGLTNASGKYLGRYQLGPEALTAVGYKDASGNWTDYAISQGVNSAKDFLNTPAAQDDALRRLTNKNAVWLVDKNLDLAEGKTMAGVTITRDGMLAGAHNLPGNTKAFIESNGVTDGTDGNKTPISKFLGLGVTPGSDGLTVIDGASQGPVAANSNSAILSTALPAEETRSTAIAGLPGEPLKIRFANGVEVTLPADGQYRQGVGNVAAQIDTPRADGSGYDVAFYDNKTGKVIGEGYRPADNGSVYRDGQQIYLNGYLYVVSMQYGLFHSGTGEVALNPAAMRDRLANLDPQATFRTQELLDQLRDQAATGVSSNAPLPDGFIPIKAASIQFDGNVYTTDPTGEFSRSVGAGVWETYDPITGQRQLVDVTGQSVSLGTNDKVILTDSGFSVAARGQSWAGVNSYIKANVAVPLELLGTVNGESVVLDVEVGNTGAIDVVGFNTINGQAIDTLDSGTYGLNADDYLSFGLTFDKLVGGTVPQTGTDLIIGLDPAAQAANGWSAPQITLTDLGDGLSQRSIELGSGVTLSSVRDDDRRIVGTITDTPDGAGGLDRVIETLVGSRWYGDREVIIQQHINADQLALDANNDGNAIDPGDARTTGITIRGDAALDAALLAQALDDRYQSPQDIIRARDSAQLGQLVNAGDARISNGWRSNGYGDAAYWYQDPKVQLLGGVLTDVQALIAAMKNGSPLPIATATFSLAASLSRNAEIIGISQGLNTLSSLSNFTDALQRGDELAAISSGASLVNNVYIEFFKSGIETQLLARAGIDLAADVTAEQYKEAIDAALVAAVSTGCYAFNSGLRKFYGGYRPICHVNNQTFPANDVLWRQAA